MATNSLEKSTCPLCKAKAEWFFTSQRAIPYFRCTLCRGIFVPSSWWLDPADEKAHYLTHNNDVFDPRYRAFVAPVVEAILSEQTSCSLGLDYGAGPGPVISRMLAESNYQTHLFDPFFHPDPSPLSERYEYIICTEVIEHFRYPLEEFARLANLLKTRGTLYCMTELCHDGIDFAKWRFKNDPTHVFYYGIVTMQWIANQFGFFPAEIDGRRIILRKR
ncbi:hypothetical protein VN12_09160 [Pirellula sp. SH-Sr6A]|uniref:class I SAM-dependent methyltransferase n=1 Tax=Pirellula sp. SH-Sr6A TaxID=1632865 RepID=UPI00078D83C4|nr:class I SAM-dependent methyltransferase [Pirellula sp. SH-Sr6A]AMV32279.1 hypothetical protein VN12_09160 [Pirellula sp. SH-Sr6A]